MVNKRSTNLAQKLLRAFLQYSRRNTNAHSTNPKLPKCPSVEAFHSYKTMVLDVEGCLLKSFSTFPYFMLVALEAGGLFRGLLLLLLYPFICLFGHEMRVKLMVIVAFCGLRKDSLRVGRAVLPKHLLEDVGLPGYEMLKRGNCRVICVSRMPRVMVEVFLREYLEVDNVLGRELKAFGGFYTGLMEEEEEKILELEGGIVGFSSSSFSKAQLPLFSYCKEIFFVEKEEKKRWQALPRERYPKPLIFHDGRIAFKPTPLNTLSMFLWLPFGFTFAFLRLTVSISLPYKLSTPILAMTNMRWRLINNGSRNRNEFRFKTNKGQLFVCNHRTLIDPIYVSAAINRHVQAVSYSLSRVSEILSPISTVRLTRDREQDSKMMGKLLDRGESVVVCPEGTTCREPYLLRFSPLFTELSDEVAPVAIDVKTSMFYATTAGGWKCFDPLYYLMNPSMCYEVQFLEKIDTSDVKARRYSSIDMANRVQREIGEALGFRCTMLTRKDKYRMLAGNDGIVR